MRELSIFADETGGQGGRSRYYALTLVLHDQDDDLSRTIRLYEESLRNRELPDIPLHAGPLLTGHDKYEYMPLQKRKQLFISFFVLFQHMPVRYLTLMYRRSEYPEPRAMSNRMRKDLVNTLFDKLDYFQSFDRVKIYYDDAQRIVTDAIHAAVGYAMASDAILYRKTRPEDYRLSQVADLLCTLELTAAKYRAKEQISTDVKFFGSAGSFKNNYLKSMKRKRLA